MAEEEVTVDAEVGDATRPSGIGRIAALPMTLIRRPMLGLAFLTCATVAGVLGYMWWPSGPKVDPEQDAYTRLQMAIEHLDNEQIKPARDIASKLRHHDELEFQHRWGPSFVLGVAMAKDAAAQWNGNERRLRYQIAARYLDESRKYGFPTDRQLDGFLWLGQSRFAAGRFDEAIPPLSEAAQLAGSGKFEVRRKLSQAYLRKPEPQLDRALENAQLELKAASTQEERHQALIDIADLQVRQGKLTAGAESIAQIPEKSSVRAWKSALRGRIAYRRALKQSPENAGPTLRAAIAAFREAAKDDPTAKQPTRISHLFRGRCFVALKELDSAKDQFAAARDLDSDSDEGIAGAIEEATVLRLLSDDNAIASYRSVIRRIHRMPSFPNLWIRLTDFRIQMVAAYTDFVDGKDFQHAIELSTILPPLVAKDEILELEASARKKWAEDLFEQAKQAVDAQRLKYQTDARRQMRYAGQAFSQLAKQKRTTRQYPEALWSAAQSFLAGNDFKNAARMTQRYLANVPRQARPRALVAIGQAHLALANLESALKAVNECIEFHALDPATYTARIVASKIYLERGQLLQAKKVLQKNLSDTEDASLAPKSLEYRDSLFALGRVHYLHAMKLASQARIAGVHRRGSPVDQKKGIAILETSLIPFRDAAFTLEKAIEKYPSSPEALMATYVAADARRQAADFFGYRRDNETIEITRGQLTKSLKQELALAVENFGKVIRSLTNRSDPSKLNETHMRMLRNSYFSKADALFGLENYADAVKAYRIITEKYDQQPITLEARVQMARCFRKLNEYKRASGSIEQAKISLKRMGPKVSFQETTRYTNRKDWQDLLEILTKTYATRLTN